MNLLKKPLWLLSLACCSLLIVLSGCTFEDQRTVVADEEVTTDQAVVTPEAPTATAAVSTAIPEPTSTPPPTEMPATVTPDVDAGWWLTTAPAPSTDRSIRTQAAFRTEDGMFEVDGAPPAIEIGQNLAEQNLIGWVGPDNLLVTTDFDALYLWNPDGSERATALCVECWDALVVDNTVFAVGDEGMSITVLSGTDLQVLEKLTPAWPTDPVLDSTRWTFALALMDGELFVVRGHRGGPSAYGGPQEIFAVDLRTRDVRFVMETESNIPLTEWARSADGQLAVGGLGARGGYCSHAEGVSYLDLKAGALQPLGSATPAGLWSDGDVDIRIIDMFWADRDLYATISWFSGPECEFEVGPALFRHDAINDVWDIIDWGPVTRVRPIGTAPVSNAKIYELADQSLYWESNGVAELLAEEGWLAGTSGHMGPVDLRPAGEVGTAEPLVRIEPYGDLAGVALYTEAEPAVAALTSALGAPTEDTGWIVGCPLDGDDLNERVLRWGIVSAEMLRLEDRELFTGWSVETSPDAIASLPVGVQPDKVALPGGLAFDTTLDAAANRLGIAAELSPVFGWTEVGGGGFHLVGYPASETDTNPTLSVASVPWVPTCE